MASVKGLQIKIDTAVVKDYLKRLDDLVGIKDNELENMEMFLDVCNCLPRQQLETLKKLITLSKVVKSLKDKPDNVSS